MAKRTTRQLSLGDYVFRDPDDSQSVFFARIAVIEATRLPLKHFLRRLADEVFVEFGHLVEQDKKLRKLTFTWQMYQSLAPRTEYEQFNDVLRAWARRFNAEEEWVLEQAWSALQRWLAFPDSKKSLEWGQGHQWREIFQSERFHFEWESWRVQFQPWTKYRASVKQAFEKAINEFESETRAAARAHGLIAAPRTHSAANFDWFVRYQFGGLSSNQISAQWPGAEKGPEASTILKGVKAAQKLIGWKCLRTDSPTRKSR